MTIDLSRLPPPKFIDELSFEDLLEDLKSDLAERYPDIGELLELTSEPANKIMETWAYREMHLRQQMNDRARRYLLGFATGQQLDWLGVNYLRVQRLEGESDSDYLRRILLGPDGVTTAGSEGGYRYHALSASRAVRAAAVLRPAPGQVRVAVLSREGSGSASADLLQTVSAALNAEKVRPLNDSVQVVSAKVITYKVRLRLSIEPGPAPSAAQDGVREQVEKWVAERHNFGAEVMLDAIRGLAYGVSGVRRAWLELPATDIICGEDEAPWCEAIEVLID